LSRYEKNRERKDRYIRLMSEGYDGRRQQMYSLSVPEENSSRKEHIRSTEACTKKKELEIQRLMDTYGNDVLRTSYMYLKDLQKAEDAFQEVFIKVFNKYERFRGKSSEKTWIIKITINVCKDILRSSWFKRVLVTDKVSLNQSDGLYFEDSLIKKDENRLLFNKVVSLPSALKDVILLYYYQSLSTAEISSILNIAEGTVRSRLYRAREMLKNKLEGRIDLSE